MLSDGSQTQKAIYYDYDYITSRKSKFIRIEIWLMVARDWGKEGNGRQLKWVWSFLLGC